MEGPKGKLAYLGNGNFYFGEGENKKYKMRRKIGMIAGGTGITPCYQVIMAALKNKETNMHITLIFGNKTEDDILLKQELEELSSEFPELFDLILIVDKPLKPESW